MFIEGKKMYVAFLNVSRKKTKNNLKHFIENKMQLKLKMFLEKKMRINFKIFRL